MMCSSQLLPGKQYTILVSNIANGGGYAYAGQGVLGKSLYLPLNFVIYLKLF